MLTVGRREGVERRREGVEGRREGECLINQNVTEILSKFRRFSVDSTKDN